MKHFSLLMLMLLAALPVFSQPDLTEPDQVIDRKDFFALGITQLSDIYPLLHRWYSSTKDGYRFDLSAAALNSFDSSQPQILIDGHAYGLDKFSKQNINLLPVTIEQIERIEVYDRPLLRYGSFASTGMLNIVTVEPEEGWSGMLRYSTGNESGDPGPYTDVDPALHNVDELGPQYAALMTFGTKRVKTSLNLTDVVYPSTDPAIYNAAEDDFRHFQLRMIGASLRTQIDAGDAGKHLLYAGYTGTGDIPYSNVYGSDLLYYKPEARFIPVESEMIQAGLSGTFDFYRSSGLAYRLSFSSHAAYPAKFYDRQTPFLKKKLYYSGLIQYSGLIFNQPFKIGFREDYYSLPAKHTLSGNEGNISLTSLYGGIAFGSRDFAREIDFMITSDGWHASLKSSFSASYRMNKKHTFSFYAAYSENLLKELKSMWRWYGVCEFAEIDSLPAFQSRDIEVKKGRLTSFEARHRYTPSQSLTLTGGFFIRIFNDSFIEYSPFKRSPAILSESTYSAEYENGMVLGINIRNNWRISPGLFSITAVNSLYIPESGSSNIFYQSFKKMPALSVTQRFLYFPVENTSFNVFLRMLFDRTAADYALEDIFIVDASLSKSFFGDRVKLHILLHNILDRRIKYEENGAVFPFTLFFKIALIL